MPNFATFSPNFGISPKITKISLQITKIQVKKCIVYRLNFIFLTWGISDFASLRGSGGTFWGCGGEFRGEFWWLASEIQLEKCIVYRMGVSDFAPQRGSGGEFRGCGGEKVAKFRRRSLKNRAGWKLGNFHQNRIRWIRWKKWRISVIWREILAIFGEIPNFGDFGGNPGVWFLVLPTNYVYTTFFISFAFQFDLAMSL